MKKRLGFLTAGTVLAAAACVGLLEPLAAQQRRALNPDDIFISEDTDSFDPGLPIGAQFPRIRALYQGREITDIDQFIRDKGAVFIANRSVDW
jgi:hypothetical protein